MASQSNFVVFPNIDVDYIKIDSDTSSSLDEAKKKLAIMDISTILKTQFTQTRIESLYFSREQIQGSIFSIYKKNPSQNYYQYVCSLRGDYSFLDYNIVSNQYYHYLASIEIIRNGASEYLIYENKDEDGHENYIHESFDSWTICDLTEDTSEHEDETIYVKTGRMWELGLNFEGESITQNLGNKSWDTLGRYPKFSAGIKNYDTMTFTGLLGKMKEYDIYDIPEIGNAQNLTGNNTYQYTEKLETYNENAPDDVNSKADERWNTWDPYARETEKLEAWKEFISNGSLKLLRDTKGNSWLVQISDSASYSIDNFSNLKQTTITFSWKEVQNVKDYSIIVYGNTPQDK